MAEAAVKQELSKGVLTRRINGPVFVLIILFTLPAFARGPGIRTGDLIIHPSAFVAGGYDSNVFFDKSDGEPLSGENAGTMVKLGTGLEMANRNLNHIGFNLDLDGAFRLMTSLDEDQRVPLGNGVADARSQVSNVNGSAGVALLPRSTFTPELHGMVRYSERASYEAIVFRDANGVSKPDNSETLPGFERFEWAIGPDLRFRPGDSPESRAFELRLGYRYREVHYGDANKLQIESAEKSAHEIGFLTKWRWLPKTMLLLDISYQLVDYPTKSELASRQGDPNASEISRAPDRDLSPLRALLGIQGLVTKRVSATLKVGYANSFNKVGESYSGFIGNAELQYVLEPTLSVTLGYSRQVLDTSFSNFAVVDGVYGRLDLVFFTKLRMGGRVGFDNYAFSRNGMPVNSTEERTDPLLRAGAYGGYNIQEWLQLRLDWSFTNNTSEYVAPNDNKIAYKRHVVLLKLGIDY